jgi:NlpC/P60 family
MAIKEIFETVKQNPAISATGLFVVLLVGAFGGATYIKISEQRIALMEQRLKQQEDFSKKQKNVLESVRGQFSELKLSIISLNTNVSSLKVFASSIPKLRMTADSISKKIQTSLTLVELDGSKLERAISQSESITGAFSILLSAAVNDKEGRLFDMPGFVSTVYVKSVSDSRIKNIDQINAGVNVSASELKAGDLVFFNTMKKAFSHVGIYVGDGKFIHSPRAGSTLEIEAIENSYWSKRFDGARRVTSPDNQPLVEGLSTILKVESVESAENRSLKRRTRDSQAFPQIH